MPYNDGTSDAVVTALATATMITTTALTHKCRCETGWLTLNAKHIEKGMGQGDNRWRDTHISDVVLETMLIARCCTVTALVTEGTEWSDGISDTLVTVLATATMMALRDGNA